MKVGVVIRQLNKYTEPVVMAVLKDPGDSVDIDNLDHYFQSKGKVLIEDLKKALPEFREAWFDVQILETD